MMTAPIEVRVGSDSDLPKIAGAFRLLEALGAPFEARVLSAHRTPERMAARARELEGAGVKVSIAAAGGSAHLPGMTASETRIPVIGIPVETRSLEGIDSLHSIIQMPEGIPVGAVGIGRAEDAALLASQIVALSDPALRARIRSRRGFTGTPAAARDFVALVGGGAEQASREAMDLLAELGVRDCGLFDPSSIGDLERQGASAIIAWAGADPALPGAIAAKTDIPVIAAPLFPGVASSDLFARLLDQGPVAGMGINRPKNAALFAARIVGLASAEVRERLRAFRERLADEVERKDATLRQKGIAAYLKDMGEK